MKKIENVKKYVEELRKESPVLHAEKNGYVLARIGMEGEVIVTYVSDGTLETVNHVKRDENGDLDVVVTMADPEGNAIVYEDGRVNVHLISRSVFNQKYEDDDHALNSQKELLFKPKGGIQEFAQIKEDVSFRAAWGEEQVIKAGSFLNVTNPNDVYGIAQEEFMQTYSIIDDN